MADNVNRIERWAAPTAGIVGALVAGIGLVMADIVAFEPVSPVASADTIARVLAEHNDRLRLGTTILTVGLFFLVWFLVHLRTRLNPDGTTG